MIKDEGGSDEAGLNSGHDTQFDAPRQLLYIIIGNTIPVTAESFPRGATLSPCLPGAPRPLSRNKSCTLFQDHIQHTTPPPPFIPRLYTYFLHELIRSMIPVAVLCRARGILNFLSKCGSGSASTGACSAPLSLSRFIAFL